MSMLTVELIAAFCNTCLIFHHVFLQILHFLAVFLSPPLSLIPSFLFSVCLSRWDPSCFSVPSSGLPLLSFSFSSFSFCLHLSLSLPSSPATLSFSPPLHPSIQHLFVSVACPYVRINISLYFCTISQSCNILQQLFTLFPLLQFPSVSSCNFSASVLLSYRCISENCQHNRSSQQSINM